MVQYLAVMLCSHTCGLTLEKSCDVLRRFGAVTPSLDRVRWISDNVLDYSAVGRGNDGSATWLSQRDQTPSHTEFEHLAFRETRRVFFHLLHMFATLDDDLFGTHAADNQVKMLNARKDDKEGHSADAVADALSRVIVALRFRRQNLSDFKSLESYRNALNKVQSTADLMIDAALDLLSHAQAVNSADNPQEKSMDAVGVEEKRALIVLAAGRKRRRISFFNSDKVPKLRLSVTGHIPSKGSHLYCVLCGRNTESDRKGWRGHRTNIRCNICSVNLCFQVYTGLRKSCWSLWHSTKQLAPRNTPHNIKSSEAAHEAPHPPEKVDSGEESDDHVDAENEVEDSIVPEPTRRSVRLRSQEDTPADP